jgi:ATP-dependent Clp protease ATP-binding subunit ClpA
LTDAARANLVRTGYDPNYGARPLKRAIQKKIETPLGKLLLKGDVRDGQRVVVDAAGESGDLTFRAEAAVAAA